MVVEALEVVEVPVETVQAVDADGATRDVGPLGAFEASFVQRLGLTLIL